MYSASLKEEAKTVLKKDKERENRYEKRLDEIRQDAYILERKPIFQEKQKKVKLVMA